ncbi:glycerol dehydrogenase [Polynucleobacter sp. IMCC30063]|uniref:glycerol dehydrogenase n=1 Tax=unclassified Polynucleobacter TaxID=2640945 RepID=UPI001F2953AC|nr:MULTISPECIES: glycerol dehydrogenase [unclassified Polynucleobacter]MCE7505481.1 glycerol dehydrogenase [Polynucleobacter sp. IMCC30063]MCE7530357.1 glycerol dehydrogenase [Polynucleobacter sp. IMCC 29146]
MTIKTMGFPGRYIQGPGALKEIPELLKSFNVINVVVILDEVVNKMNGECLQNTLSQKGFTANFVLFPGEITPEVVSQLAAQVSDLNADIVLGFGGGKTIDCAKWIAFNCKLPLFILPTIASNDSPTSRLIVLYDEHHRIARVDYMARNPDVVIVDTNIISHAPLRFFVAGLGDALSKKFEAEQCFFNQGKNFFGTPSLATARLLADKCYETILEYGEEAVKQIKQYQSPNEAVERATEASVLLSGLGFESAGLSLAHALTRGFTAHPIMTKFLHGEIVAFGSIVQLIAENRSSTEIKTHAKFCQSLGLPVSFKDFGVEGLNPLELEDIASKTMMAPYINNLSPKATDARIIESLIRANEIGMSL